MCQSQSRLGSERASARVHGLTQILPMTVADNPSTAMVDASPAAKHSERKLSSTPSPESLSVTGTEDCPAANAVLLGVRAVISGAGLIPAPSPSLPPSGVDMSSPPPGIHSSLATLVRQECQCQWEQREGTGGERGQEPSTCICHGTARTSNDVLWIAQHKAGSWSSP